MASRRVGDETANLRLLDKPTQQSGYRFAAGLGVTHGRVPALWDLARFGEPGIYHAACDGAVSWHGFTRAILDLLGLTDVVLEACKSADFPRPARRPAYSVLDSNKLARLRGRSLGPWRSALAAYLAREPL